MVSYIARLAAVVAFAAPLVLGAPATPFLKNLKIRTPDMSTEVVADSYIVVYKQDVSAAAIASHVETVNVLVESKKRAQPSAGIVATYSIKKFKGYNVIADPTTINEIANSPEVDYVEHDAKVYASYIHEDVAKAALEDRSKTQSAKRAIVSQTGAPWGLGRISHRTGSPTTYVYNNAAASGGSVYVVDTGVYPGHSQFGGRASMGANYITGSANTDENGHGTHCAGTIGGSTYGVYKTARIVGVKVLNAAGSGSNSGVISGINWVAANAPARSVLSMSLGGSYSAAVNTAVRNTVSAGVTVVVAAGNSNVNAANTSPASEPSAITVGAIDSASKRASFSNFGAVLDIFAPGVSVLSAWIGSTTATNTISGTSMATPHVAGLAAYLIALEGLSTPAAVVARIIALASTGVTTPGTGSPNRIAYNGSGA